MIEETITQTTFDTSSISDIEGIGPTLRSLREARQLTPAEVSMRLKFSQSQLNALENERWDALPHGMPLRGFVKNYARYLEADVDALLTMLDNQVGRPETAFVTAKQAPARGTATDLSSDDDTARRPWGWLIIILILVFVAGFYAIDRGWVPDSWLIFDWLQSFKK